MTNQILNEHKLYSYRMRQKRKIHVKFDAASTLHVADCPPTSGKQRWLWFGIFHVHRWQTDGLDKICNENFYVFFFMREAQSQNRHNRKSLQKALCICVGILRMTMTMNITENDDFKETFVCGAHGLGYLMLMIESVSSNGK